MSRMGYRNARVSVGEGRGWNQRQPAAEPLGSDWNYDGDKSVRMIDISPPPISNGPN